jgi:hypothetical protein
MRLATIVSHMNIAAPAAATKGAARAMTNSDEDAAAAAPAAATQKASVAMATAMKKVAVAEPAAMGGHKRRY